ncbi:MAG TPA: hypothetical protein VGX71_26985 [Pseudaminobacter sp.]|nr:hypothetical protein [Pseudaminobacter sp.]
MTLGFDMKKTSPKQVAEAAFIGLEAEEEEVLVDDFTREVKRSLSDGKPIYLNLPPLG